MEGKKDEKLRLTEDYCIDTTIHGCKYVVKSGIVRKILWVMLLSGMFVLMTVQVTNQFLFYISSPTSTNMDVSYFETMEFPAIAICNRNQFRITHVRELGLFELLIDVYDDEERSPDLRKYKDMFEGLEHSNDSRQFLVEAAHKIESMLIKCYLPDGTRCNSSHFQTYITEYGVCFTINDNKQTEPIKVDASGNKNGIYMIFDIQTYEKSPGHAETHGVKVMIYDQGSAPTISQHAVDIPPGFLTQIGIKRKELIGVPVEQGGGCVTSGNFVHFKAYEYSIGVCEIDKQVSQTIRNCGCLPFYAPDYDLHMLENEFHQHLAPVCNVEQHFACVVHQKLISTAKTGCQENCTTVKYGTSIGFSLAPKFILQRELSTEQAKTFEERYVKAIEARERLDHRSVMEMKNHISAMRKLDKWLKENRLAPIWNSFQSSFERFKTKSECFKNISENYEPIYQKIKDTFVKGFHNWNILHVLHPEIPLISIVMDYDKHLERYGEEIDAEKDIITQLLSEMEFMSKFFFKENYLEEMLMDIPEYKKTFQMLDLYEIENMSKLELSRQAILTDLQLAYISTIANPMSKNVVSNIYFHLKYNKQFAEQMDHVVNTLKSPTQKKILRQVIFESGRREPVCAKEVKLIVETMKDQEIEIVETIDYAFLVSIFCPITNERPDIELLFRNIKDCLTEEMKPIVQELKYLIASIKPNISKVFSALTEYFSDFYYDNMKSEASQTGDFLAINVFYEDMSVERQIQKKSYSFWSFLCDIGGTLGLCLGASIVTVYELIDFFILKPLCNNCVRLNQVDLSKKPSEIG